MAPMSSPFCELMPSLVQLFTLTRQKPDKLVGKTCSDHHQLFGLIARIGESPIATAALRLRPSAQSCSIRLPMLSEFKTDYLDELRDTMGGCNLHIPVEFDDGVTWYARVRLQHGLCSRDEMRLVMHSEYTTMKTMKEIAPKYVPDVWMPEQPDAIEYFFVERVDNASCPKIVLSGTGRQTTKAIHDIADYLLQVAKRPFPAIGSLYPRQGEGAQEGVPVSDTSVLAFSVDIWSTGLIRFGPFATSGDAYSTRISCYIQLLETSTEPMPDRVFTYLISLEMLALIAQCPEMAQSGPSYLKHCDDHLGNLLLRNDGSLAALIDWEYASTAPLDEAFVAPWCLLDWPRFKAGNNNLSLGEKQLHDIFLEHGRADLANAVTAGRKYHRLRQIIEFEPDGITLETLWALRTAFLGEEGAGPRPEDVNEWLQLAMERYGNDPGLDRVFDIIVTSAWSVAKDTEAAAQSAQLVAGELQCAMVANSQCPSGPWPPWAIDHPVGFGVRVRLFNAVKVPRLRTVVTAARAAADNARVHAAKAAGYSAEARGAYDALQAAMLSVHELGFSGEILKGKYVDRSLSYDPVIASVRWTALVNVLGDAANATEAAAQKAEEALGRCEAAVFEAETALLEREGA